ncbi:MAG TPA: peptide chain release factor 1 [Syntrophales bacterium]|nr:peptide chain release factor 1 [Syntrophales bacterium]HOL59879.1 peptide chain release factor 1 [Syntrophales bacterium]HPO36026.1 peptide chain release factor 1 [Syntrophales bacterium]
MFQRLAEIDRRYRELEQFLGDPEVIARPSLYQRYAKEHADLQELVFTYREYERVLAELEEGQRILKGDDEELKTLVKEDLPGLKEKKASLEEKLKLLLLPRDANDQRSVLLEIRAGTGGDEATLFAADLFRMYARYAEKQGWRVEVVSTSPSGGLGGFKEIIALIEGEGVYSRLKYESGVHRVQRVPVTEAQGRIHTSAVTVAIMPEAEEVEVEIDPKDIRIDVFHSSGHGGQSVNTTDSAVRITHLPTGIVVSCQDEKSQHKNKAKAMKVLRARLLDQMVSKQNEELARMRKSQVGSGDRSERIRTYNFPQGRVTDHRINLTVYNLEEFLDGEIGEMVDALIAHYQAEALKSSMSQVACS